MNGFRLFAEEHPVFTFDDYGALLSEARLFGAGARVLEFGPGYSTLALLEAGCAAIDSCEHNARWLERAEGMFKGNPVVRLHAFFDRPHITPQDFWPPLPDAFDLAFVDAPVGIGARSATRHPGQEGCSRFNTLSFALQVAPVALLHDAKRPGEQATLRRFVAQGCRVEMIDCVKGLARVSRANA